HRGGICHGRSAHHYGHATTPPPNHLHRLAPRASRLPRYHRAELHADVPVGAGLVTSSTAANCAYRDAIECGHPEREDEVGSPCAFAHREAEAVPHLQHRRERANRGRRTIDDERQRTDEASAAIFLSVFCPQSSVLRKCSTSCRAYGGSSAKSRTQIVRSRAAHESDSATGAIAMVRPTRCAVVSGTMPMPTLHSTRRHTASKLRN